MQVRSRLIMLPLLNKYRVVTSGNVLAAKTLIELDVDGFESLLPHAEELVLFTVGESMSTNINWGIWYTTGFDRTLEVTSGTPPFQIGATVTQALAGPTRHTALAANTNFQLVSRLFVGFWNSAGVTTYESGVCSAALGVKTWGM